MLHHIAEYMQGPRRQFTEPRDSGYLTAAEWHNKKSVIDVFPSQTEGEMALGGLTVSTDFGPIQR